MKYKRNALQYKRGRSDPTGQMFCFSYNKKKVTKRNRLNKSISDHTMNLFSAKQAHY